MIEEILTIFDIQEKIIDDEDEKYKIYLDKLKLKFDAIIHKNIIKDTGIDLNNEIVKEVYESRNYPIAYFKNIWTKFMKPHLYNAIAYNALNCVKQLLDLNIIDENIKSDFIQNIQNVGMANLLVSKKEIVEIMKSTIKLPRCNIFHYMDSNIGYIIFNKIQENCIQVFVNAAIEDNMLIFMKYPELRKVSNSYSNSIENYLLRWITGKCNIKYIEILLENGADPNNDEFFGNDIGNIIFEAESLEELKLFKKYGARFNSLHGSGRSSLEHLAESTLLDNPKFDINTITIRYEKIKYYLENGGIFDDTCSLKFLKIIFSCKKLFYLIINNGFNVNSEINDSARISLLLYLIELDYLRNWHYFANILLKNGATIPFTILNANYNSVHNYRIKNNIIFVKNYLYPDEY